jgi:hypothetical protein
MIFISTWMTRSLAERSALRGDADASDSGIKEALLDGIIKSQFENA